MHLPPPLRIVLLGVGLLLFHLLGCGQLPLIDRDEPRFAEASREMLARGDYIVPYFNNRERFDKPPLTYWCQAACYRVLGENEVSARLPSALAAVLIALLLVWMGPHFGANGWRAAFIFSLSLQTVMHARAAVADMLLVLFTTIGFAAGWRLCQPAAAGPRRPWAMWAVFWLSLGLGFLAKGPVAWLPVGAVGILAWLERPAGLNRRFGWILGPLVTLSIVAAWGIPALQKTKGAFWDVGMERHVISRTLQPMEGHGGRGWLGYLLSLPLPWLTALISLFPWSFRLPGLVGRLWRSSRLDASERYLVAGVLLTFGIFTFSATKLPHYTLPAFPLLALLLDRHWPSVAGSSRRFTQWVSITSVGVVSLLLVVPARSTWFFPTELLYRQMEPWLRPEMEFASVDYQEPSLVWKFRGRVQGWHFPLKRDKVVAFMAKPGARFCIVPTEMAATLFPIPDPSWRTTSVRGFHIPKGRTVSLTAYVKLEKPRQETVQRAP